jgi:hypothetical protein
MSLLDALSEGHVVPVVSMEEKIADLQSRLDLQTFIATNLRIRNSELEIQIGNVKGYLIDCLDMGDSPDAESIADYLDIELKREFAVRVEVVFDFVVTAVNEDEAQEMADNFSYSADGDFDSDDYEVTDTTVSEA